jgi:hypothetical protein
LRTLLRPEPVALLATCLAYLAAIRLFTPEYLTTIVPILRDTYWAIGDLTIKQLLAESIELHILAVVAVAFWFILRLWWQRPADPLAVVFLVAGAASALAYYLQGTGWYYQQIPALSFFAFALCAEVAEIRKHVPGAKARVDARSIMPELKSRPISEASSSSRDSLSPQESIPSRESSVAARSASEGILRYAPIAAVALSLLAIALTAYFSGYTLAHPLGFPNGLSDTPDPALFAGLPPGTPVAILTTVVDDSVPPIFTHHLLWAQRQNNRLAQLDQIQHAWMVEDLQRWRPQLILIARCQDPSVHCQIVEDRHDNLLAWFARDPAFRAEFANYRYLRSAGPYDAYVPR